MASFINKLLGQKKQLTEGVNQLQDENDELNDELDEVTGGGNRPRGGYPPSIIL